MNARALILSFAVAMPGATAADEPKAVKEVAVCKPIAEEVTDYFEFCGHAEAAERVEIRARVSGLVAKVLFKEGSQVKKGDALFELDGRIQQKELEKAKAGLIKAEATVKASIDNLARVEDAFKKGGAGQQEIDRAKAECDVAKATALLKQAGVTGKIALDLMVPNNPETRQVAELIVQLKKEGIGIFLISHDIHDVFDLADRVAVMKNGKLVGTAPTRAVSKDEVLGMIIIGTCPSAAIPGPGAVG